MIEQTKNIQIINKNFCPSNQLSLKYLNIIKHIGSGSFSKVYQVQKKDSPEFYALKILTKQQIENLGLEEQLNNEIQILLQCDHPNIIKLHAIFEDSQCVYLITELAEKGNLYQYLLVNQQLSEQLTAKFLHDIVKAISYLHDQTPPIIHRDIKLENILLIDDKIVLADFGWSNQYSDVRNTYCGTPDYLSPEMILGVGHNEKLDIWSMGILLYEMLHGSTPFKPSKIYKDSSKTQQSLENNILSGKFQIDQNLSPQARDLIKKMLRAKPSQRISSKDILNHEFFQSYGINKKQKKSNKYYKDKLKLCEKALQKYQTKCKKQQMLLDQKNVQIEFQKNLIESYQDQIEQEKFERKEKLFIFNEQFLQKFDAQNFNKKFLAHKINNFLKKFLESISTHLEQDVQCETKGIEKLDKFVQVLDQNLDKFQSKRKTIQKQYNYTNKEGLNLNSMETYNSQIQTKPMSNRHKAHKPSLDLKNLNFSNKQSLDNKYSNTYQMKRGLIRSISQNLIFFTMKNYVFLNLIFLACIFQTTFEKKNNKTKLLAQKQLTPEELEIIQGVLKNKVGENVDLQSQNLQKDEDGNLVINIKKDKASEDQQQEQNKDDKNNQDDKVKEGQYTVLQDKVIKLLKDYHQKYPECVYIPPKLIPNEEMHIKRESQTCKENFKRGWVMGTNWAKLFFMNNYPKEEGWKQLQDTGDFFLTNWKQKKDEFECAYRGLKQGYYNNFELLEDDNNLIELKSYEDLVQVQYDNLEIFYNKLKNKLNGEESEKHTLSLNDQLI